MSLCEPAVAAAQVWVSAKHHESNNTACVEAVKSFSCQQLQVFLDKLLQSSPFASPLLKEMDRRYSFTTSRNSEIRSRWQLLCVKSNHEDILGNVIEFLEEQGRMKFVRPMYQALHASPVLAFREAAVHTFERNRNSYHPICASMIARDLAAASTSSEAKGNSSHKESDATVKTAETSVDNTTGQRVPLAVVVVGTACLAFAGIMLSRHRSSK